MAYYAPPPPSADNVTLRDVDGAFGIKPGGVDAALKSAAGVDASLTIENVTAAGAGAVSKLILKAPNIDWRIFTDDNDGDILGIYDGTNGKYRGRFNPVGGIALGPAAFDVTTPVAGVVLDLQGVTGALRVPRMTTAQRDALANLVDGTVIYNSTTATLQVRQGAAWANAS